MLSSDPFESPREFLAEWEAIQPSTSEELMAGLGFLSTTAGDALRNASALGLISAPETGTASSLVTTLSSAAPYIVGTDVALKALSGLTEYSARINRDAAYSKRLKNEVELRAEYNVLHALVKQCQHYLVGGDLKEADLQFKEITNKLENLITKMDDKITQLKSRKKEIDSSKKNPNMWLGVILGGGSAGLGAKITYTKTGSNMVMAGGIALLGLIAWWKLNGDEKKRHTQLDFASIDIRAFESQREGLNAMCAAQYFQWALVAMSQSRYQASDVLLLGALPLFEEALVRFEKLNTRDLRVEKEVKDYKARCYFLLAETVDCDRPIPTSEPSEYREKAIASTPAFSGGPTDTLNPYHFLNAFRHYHLGNFEPNQALRSVEHCLSELRDTRSGDTLIPGVEQHLKSKFEIAASILKAKILVKMGELSSQDQRAQAAKISGAITILESLLVDLEPAGGIFSAEKKVIFHELSRYTAALDLLSQEIRSSAPPPQSSAVFRPATMSSPKSLSQSRTIG